MKNKKDSEIIVLKAEVARLQSELKRIKEVNRILTNELQKPYKD